MRWWFTHVPLIVTILLAGSLLGLLVGLLQYWLEH